MPDCVLIGSAGMIFVPFPLCFSLVMISFLVQISSFILVNAAFVTMYATIIHVCIHVYYVAVVIDVEWNPPKTSG